ncbi:ATP-dependent DNA ligase [Streptomyces vinaceus]|uniref:ATP-dependent DNA ligase n=1 Tax=Streptomyces vinaceus TaxID=1960 RepID=UPI00380BC381
MDLPVPLALAQAVPRLPHGAAGVWWYEPKFDGHRVVLERTEETVRLYARSGRVVTSPWMDLAVAGMQLEPGTVLDGEAVIWSGGRLDFAAVQARAASGTDRSRTLAGRLPASYAVWDILSHPVHGDVRGRRYTERRRLLLDVLAPVGPPIQAVPATDDYDIAMTWYESLQSQGIEGIVAKRAASTYKGGRIWWKTRHAETTEALVVGFTGSPSQPRALAVRLDDGRTVLTQRLPAALSRAAAAYLADTAPGPPAATATGDAYTTTTVEDLMVEVLAGTTRHQVVTATRLR